jgi:hypothetical protein
VISAQHIQRVQLAGAIRRAKSSEKTFRRAFFYVAPIFRADVGARA